MASFTMKQGNLYENIFSMQNLISAWKKTRKGKTKKPDVKKFEEDLAYNLKKLHDELKNETYFPKPLTTFLIQDPKTRLISKSHLRDRLVHHALIKVIGEFFEKSFIHSSCANQKGKGNLFTIRLFDKYKRRVTANLQQEAFCLKCDIKHYFQEVNPKVLLEILSRKIKDEEVINLIIKILQNYEDKNKGMPLGNLTSQFFANVYLNELDYFAKHQLKCKYYIRYVDDFVILHKSKQQLEIWKNQISKFLNNKLRLELPQDKSRIISLSRGLDFVGFRNFYYFRLLRKRNIENIKRKIHLLHSGEISFEKFCEIYQGWQAYASWADTYELRIKLLKNISSNFQNLSQNTREQY